MTKAIQDNDLSEKERLDLINSINEDYIVFCLKKIGILSYIPEIRDEIFQEAKIGIWLASKKFDKTKNVKFRTYAFYWIKMTCLRFFDREARYNNPIMAGGNTEMFFNEKNGKYHLKRQRKISIHSPINFEFDGKESTLEDTISDQKSSYFDKEIIINQNIDNLKKQIYDATQLIISNKKNKNVADMSLTIISQRILSENPISIDEISRKFSVSKQNIHQMEKIILKQFASYFGKNVKKDNFNLNTITKSNKRKILEKQKEYV